jgi:transcription-repair coupling factor (superfamily II helicase)
VREGIGSHLAPAGVRAGLSSLSAALQAGRSCALTGLTGSAPALHLLLLQRELRRSFLVVTPGDVETERWERNLGTWRAWLGEDRLRIDTLPSLDADPYQGLSPHLQVSCERVVALNHLLSGETALILVPARSLFYHVPSPSLFAASRLVVRPGESLSPDRLCALLIPAGYIRVEHVSSPGEFARRGGIVDLFLPQGEVPCRLEFFGEVIESIRSFNPETQRSMEMLESAEILPVREIPLESTPLETLRSRLLSGEGAGESGARRNEALLEEIRQEGHFPGIEAFARLMDPDAPTVPRFAPTALLVVDEPEAVREEIRKGWDEILSTFEFSEAFGLPAPREVFADRESLERTIAAAPLVLSELPLTERPGEWKVSCRPGRSFQDRLPDLATELSAAAASGWKVLLAVGSHGRMERLGEILRDLGEPATLVEDPRAALPPAAARLIVPGHLEGGFSLPDSGLMVVAEREIFGEIHEKEARRRKVGVFSPDFRDLKVGDPVVHADHGIARYAGVIRMEENGRTADFMELHFEGKDRLFVPVERLDLVQRYSGAGGHVPKLDRLGGVSWERTKRKVRRAMRDMAEELLQLYAARKAAPGHAFGPDTPWQREFETSFPYEETADQKKAIEEVKSDMESSLPMDRLVCGDVGFGKTEVALRAAFKSVMEGKQVAILVPTTVLAAQHLNTFRERFSGFPVRVEVLSRFRTPAEQRAVAKELEQGKVDVIIGTHRLLSRDVKFKDLGVLVVDEEQRFGVAAKERIKQFKKNVDVLAMSATPIPRTLQLSLAGIRDLSVIETPPKNRLAIQTHIVPFRAGVIAAALRNEMKRGGQIYFVHNRVESIASMANLLRRIVPEARIAVAHGQMAERELERTMLQFLQGESDLLLSTTIIENGLDIPRVNTILVNRADRFGLAQLYQLRGRVGRSDRRAYAYLLVPPRTLLAPVARKRLKALQEFSDLGSGFRIAAMDLEIRGAGNLLGAEQHGHIAAVGFDTYCSLLERTVQELKGEAVLPEVRTSINLRTDIRLPEEYIPDFNQRLSLYKWISSAQDRDELDRIREEMRDRYGKIPRQGENLFTLAELRILAEKLRVASLDYAGDRVSVRFAPDSSVAPQRLIEIVSKSPGAVLTPQGVLRLPVGASEEARVRGAQTLLKALL